jgi:hypothetical protein
MMLTQLATVARRTGYPVIEVPGWKTRTTTDEHGRPEQMADVLGVTCHHTANGGARGDAPSLHTVRDGRPDLEGPLAHYVLGVSGAIYVVAAGHANHAGRSLKPGYQSGHRIGIEAEAIGLPGSKSDWPGAQMDAYARLCAALVDEFDFTVADVLGHKETCSPPGRKSDPSFSMPAFRRQVAAVNLRIRPAQEDAVDEKTLKAIGAAVAEHPIPNKNPDAPDGPPSSIGGSIVDIERTQDAHTKLLGGIGAEQAAQRDLLEQVLKRLPPVS